MQVLKENLNSLDQFGGMSNMSKYLYFKGEIDKHLINTGIQLNFGVKKIDFG